MVLVLFNIISLENNLLMLKVWFTTREKIEVI